jgi:hypothetical protein
VLGHSGGPERFRREAELSRRLDHPNVVRVLDAGIDGPILFTAFELLEGQTLEDLIATGPTPIREVCDLALEILAGLEEAHRLGIVHRDLKPANLFREYRQGQPGRVKLLDFGVAKSTNPNTVAGLTREGIALGTPAYMAPEQLAGMPASPPADLFALDLVLAELCMGAPVYPDSASALDLLRERLSGGRPPIPAWVTSSPLGPVLLAATTPDPAARTASAAAMRDAIAQVRANLPAPTAPTPRTRPPRITILGTAPTDAVPVRATGAQPMVAPVAHASAPSPPLGPSPHAASVGYAAPMHAGPAGSHAATPAYPVAPPMAALRPGPSAVAATPHRRFAPWGIGLGVVAVLGLVGAGLVLRSENGSDAAETGEEDTKQPASSAEPKPTSSAAQVGSSSVATSAMALAAPATAPERFEAMPLAVGQWVRMKTVKGGATTLVEYRIVGKRGESWVMEQDAETNGIKSTVELVLRFGDRTRVDGVSLESGRVKAAGRVMALPTTGAGAALAELQRSLRIPPIDGSAREDVTVEAGRFEGCWVRDVDETVFGEKVKQRTFAHASVPINALVLSEGTVDGKPSRTELIAFGTTGAKATF